MNKGKDNRRMLINLTNGSRPDYWIEIFHHSETGAIAYGLHMPFEKHPYTRHGISNKPLVGYTPLIEDWDALCISIGMYLGNDYPVDAIPKYDNGRTYYGHRLNAKMAASIRAVCERAH